MRDFLDKEFHPTEMYKLINMLIKRGDKDFKVVELWDCPQVMFYDDNGGEIGDAVCHRGSYGHEEGLIEIMGLGEEDVRGYMTAVEVIEQLDNFRKEN